MSLSTDQRKDTRNEKVSYVTSDDREKWIHRTSKDELGAIKEHIYENDLKRRDIFFLGILIDGEPKKVVKVQVWERKLVINREVL